MPKTHENANTSLRRANRVAIGAQICVGAVGMMLIAALPASAQSTVSAQPPAGTVMTLADAGQIGRKPAAAAEASAAEFSATDRAARPIAAEPTTQAKSVEAARLHDGRQLSPTHAMTPGSDRCHGRKAGEQRRLHCADQPTVARASGPRGPAYELKRTAQAEVVYRQALSSPRARQLVREVQAILNEMR